MAGCHFCFGLAEPTLLLHSFRGACPHKAVGRLLLGLLVAERVLVANPFAVDKLQSAIWSPSLEVVVAQEILGDEDFLAWATRCQRGGRATEDGDLRMALESRLSCVLFCEADFGLAPTLQIGFLLLYSLQLRFGSRASITTAAVRCAMLHKPSAL